MTQTVSTTLNLAADLIEERGWAIGTGWDTTGNGPLCLEGAIGAAMGLRRGTNICPAGQAVKTYLGEIPWIWNDDLVFEVRRTDPRFGKVPLSEWRDESHTTAAARVIEVLRATAVIEAARESESEAASAALVSGGVAVR